MIVQAGCIDTLHEIDWKVHLTPKHTPLEKYDFVITFPILCGTKYPVLYNKTLLFFGNAKLGDNFCAKERTDNINACVITFAIKNNNYLLMSIVALQALFAG